MKVVGISNRVVTAAHHVRVRQHRDENARARAEAQARQKKFECDFAWGLREDETRLFKFDKWRA